MDIHTQQLRHFMELAKCLNFTKAAMNLYIAQPALSQQIADLEKQLGVTLFERTSRSVTLTPAGEILMERCPDILNKISDIHQQLLSAQAGLRGNLKLGYTESFQTMLPDIVQKYRGLYPDVAVELFTGYTKNLRIALRNQNADVIFAIVDEKVLQESNASAHRLIWKEGLSLIVRKDHPFVTSGGQDYSLLRDMPFCMLDEDISPEVRRAALKVCGEIGIPSSNPITCKTSGPIFIQAESGMVFSIVPSSLAELACTRHPNLAIFPISEDSLFHCALWNPDSRNAVLPLFLDVLEMVLGTK